MMNLKSFLTKFFRGYEVLETVNSPINGGIKVVEGLFGGRSMIIGKVSQSGYLVEKLWKVALSLVQSSKFKVQSCLILGLGCGDAARLMSQKWPEAKITGVEIDERVIELGKKYFGLNEIKNLKIIAGDAIRGLKTQNSKLKAKTQNSKLDLILVDLYLGREYPKEAESQEFINGVKEILADGGIAIFNRLSYGELSGGAVKFSGKLRNFFPKVWTKRAITNLLIFCQK